MKGNLDLGVIEVESFEVANAFASEDTFSELGFFGGNVNEPKVLFFGPQED